MRRFFFALTICILAFSSIKAIEINKVEPPSWWIGMNSSSLQLMLYGNNISDATFISENPNIKVVKIKKADSPNYLFVDLKLSAKLKAGTYNFIIVKGSEEVVIKYLFETRRENSGKRESFGPEDVVYLLMPDRFVNGDKTNDDNPQVNEKSSTSHPYGRHGGDIQGMINSLEYLKELGISAIWSTPLLLDNEPVASYHGYACADYYKIDPRFGTNELYREYVSLAKGKGIKVIMDMVPNHSGLSHWWMKDLPFGDWIHKFPKYTQSNFAMSTHADIHASSNDLERCITGWFDTSMPDMNLTNPFLNSYFTQNAIWWVEWADLSGIRVDTYPYSDKNAISSWTKNILREYPKLNIVGECWFSSPQEIAYWEGASKNKDGYSSNLKSVMDFPLQEAINSAFMQSSQPNWGEGMHKIYRSLSLDFTYGNPYNILIFGDNHDTHRISETLKGDVAKMKMFITLLSTMRGTPQIYYGTEIMLKTSDGKLGHGEERLDMPDLSSISTSQKEVYNYTKKILNWRKESEVIHKGNLVHYWPYNNLYVYFRILEKEIVMVAINNNDRRLSLDWSKYSDSIKGKKSGTEIISGKKISTEEELIIQPQSSYIISFN